jgi:hypothetical protein
MRYEMMKIQVVPEVTSHRHARWMRLALAATIGVGAGVGQGMATAAEEAAVPVDGATKPIIVTKSMKAKALKDAGAGVRGEAPAAPSAPAAAAAAGTRTSSPPNAQQPAPGAGATK